MGLDYRVVGDSIYFDRTINSLIYTLMLTQNTIDITKEGIRQRKGEIALQHEIAYKDNDSLRNAFKRGKEISRNHMKNATIVTMRDANGKEHQHYFSKPLGGVWVKGTPEKRADGYYCKVTNEKL